jgi:hypothetical protein
MKHNQKFKGIFHTVESFKKYGFKQLSTWAGIAIFILLFEDDLMGLVHNILRSANLSEKLATGLAGFVLVSFNKLGKK